MNVKTEIRYPYIYEHILNNRTSLWTLEEYNCFKERTKNFVAIYKTHIHRIIALIEQYTQNTEWQYSFIPIYLISDQSYKAGQWSGFSDPLTLRFLESESSEKLLKTLIHELVHVNLSLELQLSKSYKDTEEIVHSIADKVWSDLTLR